MNEQSKQTSTPNSDQERSFFGVVIHSFFVVPFLIAVFCVLLFAGVTLLTREQHTVYDYLHDVKTGGITKRWQAAFELSKILANPELVPQEDRFVRELTAAFAASDKDDPRVRQYLALAMGRSGNPAFVTPLTEALEEDDADRLPGIIYALGTLKAPLAVGPLLGFTNHPEPRIRSLAVAALGTIASPKARTALRLAVQDSEPNVRWGAALGLARMSDAGGKSVIARLLQERYLDEFPELDRVEQQHLQIAAIGAAQDLNDQELLADVASIARNAADLKVRAIARKALQQE